MDGISFTHGAPSERVHIWSFPAATTIYDNDDLGCPCASSSSSIAPSIVDGDYYCDSVANTLSRDMFFTNVMVYVRAWNNSVL